MENDGRAGLLEIAFAFIVCAVSATFIVGIMFPELSAGVISAAIGGTWGISLPFLDEPVQLPALGSVNTGEVESAILKYTNEERQKHGVAPLTGDTALATIARRHSEDMAHNHYLSHDNPEGDGPTDRARKYGYPLRKDLGNGWFTEGIGENIGTMVTGEIEGFGIVINTPNAVARAHVDAWMQSPGHKKNILDPQYSRLGVGVAYDGHTYYYATQNFW